MVTIETNEEEDVQGTLSVTNNNDGTVTIKATYYNEQENDSREISFDISDELFMFSFIDVINRGF